MTMTHGTTAGNATHPCINMFAVCARNDHARQVIAGFATAANPVLPGLWQQVDLALADVPVLGSVIAGLAAELAAARLESANLLAAMRAALAADADGESDPLFYLRDEVGAPVAIAEELEGARDDG